jgi:hypothetical protein
VIKIYERPSEKRVFFLWLNVLEIPDALALIVVEILLLGCLGFEPRQPNKRLQRIAGNSSFKLLN